MAVITWADAAQNNRHNKGSTVGLFTALAPKEIINGESVLMNVVAWKSQKAPRETLGSNGSEVQAITMGADLNCLVRSMWMEFHGIPLRGRLEQEVREHTTGVLVMDSRGVYDAMTRNMSALHGLRSSRAGYELTVAVQQAMAAGTILRWVAGTEMLADSLNKTKARKTILDLLAERHGWRLVYDPSFTAGRKLTKREAERKMQEVEVTSFNSVKAMAAHGNFPWGPKKTMKTLTTACSKDSGV